MLAFGQIIPTFSPDHDIVSIFTYNPIKKAFEECDRTVHDALRFYRNGDDDYKQEDMAFGVYFEEDNYFLICPTAAVCSFEYYIGSMKTMHYFMSGFEISAFLFRPAVVKLK